MALLILSTIVAWLLCEKIQSVGGNDGIIHYLARKLPSRAKAIQRVKRHTNSSVLECMLTAWGSVDIREINVCSYSHKGMRLDRREQPLVRIAVVNGVFLEERKFMTKVHKRSSV
jgi:hypothetical protein